MSDAFLESDLSLDIRAALGQVDRLNEAVHRATTNVRITADVRQVTTAIDAAVDAADASLRVTADTTSVTGSIDGAVDAADSHVVITGDAAELTGEVTAAVDAGDSNVTVTGSVSPGLRGDVVELGDAVDDASDSAGHLRQVLGLLSVGAAVAGLRALADAASDLQESTSKAGTVFGDQFADIRSFAEGAAESTGLAQQEALEATATFGNLFQALGQSREEAARMSPEVVQLAADLASFNNLGVDETLEKLRSGLVGEVEPLRSLGVSFLAADVNARGLELGLGDLNGELSEGEKVQARLSLITEQTALAHGDFARTADGLANQQRILSAEFKNAAAQGGTLLLPMFEALIAEGRDILPALEEMASVLLPALSDAFVNLAPLIGTTVDLFVLASPAIAAVLEVVAAVPTELIQLAAGLLLVNKGFTVLQATTKGVPAALSLLPKILQGTASAATGATNTAGPLAKGITGIGTALTTVNPLLVGAGILAAGAFKEWQAGKERAAAVAKQTDSLAASLAGVGTEFESARQATKSWLDDLVAAGGEIETTSTLFEGIDASKAITALGLDTRAAADLIAGGAPAVKRFTDGLGELSDEEKVAAVALDALATGQNEAAKATLTSLAATDQLTGAQQAQLDALNETNAPAEAYVRLLDEATAAQRRTAAEAERLVALYGPVADQFVNTGAALDSLRESAPAVASSIQALRTGGAEPTTRAFQDLVFQIGEAALSEEQMADAAALLGTDVETLTDLVDRAEESLATFVDTASGALPTIEGAFELTDTQGKILEIDEFVANLDRSREAIADFRSDLQVLASAGFADIAGIIAEQGPEVGGALAAELVGALEDGNVEVLEKVREATDGFQSEWETTTAFYRDTIGPEMILQSGLLGAGITEAFGSELGFSERIRIAAALAKSGLSIEGQAIAAIAATEGAQAARDYGTALNLDDKTVQAAIEAGVAIKANAPIGAARQAGSDTGKNFGAGIVDGMTLYTDDINTKAAQLVLSARNAAARAAQEGSPSKLFRELGINMALGTAEGLEAEADTVAAMAAQMVDAANAAAAAALPATVDPSLVGAPGSIDSSTSIVFAPGSVVVQAAPGMTREEAAEVGAGVIDGAARALEARRIALIGRVQ